MLRSVSSTLPNTMPKIAMPSRTQSYMMKSTRLSSRSLLRLLPRVSRPLPLLPLLLFWMLLLPKPSIKITRTQLIAPSLLFDLSSRHSLHLHLVQWRCSLAWLAPIPIPICLVLWRLSFCLVLDCFWCLVYMVLRYNACYELCIFLLHYCDHSGSLSLSCLIDELLSVLCLMLHDVLRVCLYLSED